MSFIDARGEGVALRNWSLLLLTVRLAERMGGTERRRVEANRFDLRPVRLNQPYYLTQ